MKRATTVVLALGALLGGAAAPASAEVVIGGDSRPSVEVNWAVLDSLGNTPSLPQMLKSELPGTRALAPAAKAGQPVQYRPYKAEAPAKKVVVTKPKAIPVTAKSEPKPAIAREVAELADAAKNVKAAPEPVKAAPQPVKAAPEPVKAAPQPVKVAPEPIKAVPAVAVKPAKPDVPAVPEPVKLAPQNVTPVAAPAPVVAPAKPAGPQIALPEVPKPEPVKPEPVKAEPPKPVTPAPAPVQAKIDSAITPPPAPIAVPQIASLPPQVAPAVAAGSSMHGDTLSVLFGGGENAKLPEAARADLDRLARRMEKEESLGLQLLAYAGADDSNASKARRLSLSRALEVRKYLMEQGVRSTRIEVRALGNKVDNGPADRVDAVFTAR